MPFFFVVFVLAFSITCGSGDILVGGITTQDPDDPEFMMKAWKAAQYVSSSGANHMVPIKVVKAQSQVVGGMKYILEVLFGESICPKKGSITPAMMANYCYEMNGGRRALYKVEIYERAWENFEQFTVKKIRDVASDDGF